MTTLVAGSRGSRLALVQTNYIANSLACDVTIKKIITRGDKIHDVALARLEGKGFFTKEIDDALLNNEIDFAVHSFKDIPTDLPEGIIIAAVPKRESQNDALVGKYISFDDLPKNAKVGTSSLRRKSEALHLRSDICVEDLRGNLDTRIRKVSEGLYDVVIVAEAGLKRLGFQDYHPLNSDVFIPAACQGALAITARKNDKKVLDFLAKLEDKPTRISCEFERSFLTILGGGCQIPAGIYTQIDPDKKTVTFTGFISSLDGKHYHKITDSGPLEQGTELIKKLSQKLLDAGGKEIIEDIRESVI